MSKELVERIFIPAYRNDILAELNDQAVFNIGNSRLAFSTDTFVIDPIFFPGGDIGRLAVFGTVNDIAMSGARAIFLSVGFIIEEGFPISDIEKIVLSMSDACKESGVKIVTGDTKVVDRGGVDKIFINTSGIGVIEKGINISGDNVKKGDKVIISGYIGDHGIAVLSKREGLEFGTSVISDLAPLNSIVSDMLMVCNNIHAMRDPTRGGLATTLNEIAIQSSVGILIDEDIIPIREEVKAACEILGLDPLYIANEGKLVAFVGGEHANDICDVMKKNPVGRDAAIIGEVIDDPLNKVYMKTRIGGTRIINMLTGDQLPRIC